MQKKAFTLIEMIIVLMVVSLLIPTVFSIVYVIMRQEVRIYRVVETRRQGDYMLTFIKDKIIRSKEIDRYTAPSTFVAQCTTNGSSYSSTSANPGADTSFVDNDDNKFRIYQNTTNKNLIYEAPPGSTATTINNSRVQISNFTISCARKSTLGAPLINIAFTVTFKDTTAVSEDPVVLNYQTKIKLRE